MFKINDLVYNVVEDDVTGVDVGMLSGGQQIVYAYKREESIRIKIVDSNSHTATAYRVLRHEGLKYAESLREPDTVSVKKIKLVKNCHYGHELDKNG